ncbi:MAG: transporter, partial [Caulobacteraceae bacterium]
QDAAAPSQSAGPAGAAQLDLYKQRIEADEKALGEQAKELADQKAMLEAQKRELDGLKASMDNLNAVRAEGVGSAGENTPIATAVDANAQSGGGAPAAPPPPTDQPVGKAPPPPPTEIALPYGINVLTPPGHLVWETGVDYQNSASNRLVFEGVEISNAFLIGVIQANETQNNTVIYWDTLRYGVTPRFEIEASVPYVARYERVTTVQAANNQLSQTRSLSGNGIGDIQMIGRYQLTAGRPGEPILVANLEIKGNTGRGPYNVNFDAGGAAQSLPVGSGFFAVEPSLSWVYPLDPIVLFGNIGYQHSFGYNVNRVIGGVLVGDVDPGDGYSAAIGFSFALNQRFSYSLGFRNDFFLGTATKLGAITGNSGYLEAGSLLLGGSYRINNRLNVNLNFEFGVTPDAPNTTIMLRMPYVF